jgi:hypothetical protein
VIGPGAQLVTVTRPTPPLSAPLTPQHLRLHHRRQPTRRHALRAWQLSRPTLMPRHLWRAQVQTSRAGGTLDHVCVGLSCILNTLCTISGKE